MLGQRRRRWTNIKTYIEIMLINSFIHSFTPSFNSYVCPFVHSFIHAVIYHVISLFIYSCARPPVCSSIHSFIILFFHLPALIIAVCLYLINFINFSVNLLNTALKLLLFFFKCISEACTIVSRNSYIMSDLSVFRTLYELYTG